MEQDDLRLAQQKNPHAFECLVAPYLRGLYGFIVHRVGEEAEDVYQDALLSAWYSIGRYTGGSSLKTWLYAIAGNKCMDHLRKKYRTPHTTELDERTAGPGFEEQSDRTLDLHSAMETLASQDKALLYLVYAQGMTVAQAAQVMDIPEGTVKSRLFTLRKRLRNTLEGGTHEH